MWKRLGALLLALPFSCAVFLSRIEYASAGTQYYERATVSGAIPIGGEAVLESEVMTLHISDLPGSGDAASQNHMTADSTFYNPKEKDVTLELVYPCPDVPSDVSARSYELLLDGQPLQSSVRHSYVGYFNRTFDIDDCIKQLNGNQFDFYRSDLTVYNYTFYVDIPHLDDQAGNKFYTLMLAFNCNPTSTRIMSNDRMNTELVNGMLRMTFELKEGENKVTFTVAGWNIGHLNYGVYSALTQTENITASITYRVEMTTFGKYAMSFYPEGCSVSEEDWIMGMGRMLTLSTTDGCIVYALPASLREEAFLKWCTYSFTIPAKGRVVHTVSAPLYPIVEDNKCKYDILLSPLAYWDISDFRIRIDTPYYLAYSNLQFDESEGGYDFSRDCLPLGELSLTIAPTADVAEPTGGSNISPGSPTLNFAYILLGVLGGVAVIGGGVVCAAVLLRKKKHR